MHKEYTVYHIRLRTTETRFSPHPRASKTIAKAFLLWIKNVTLPYQWTKDVATIKPSHCSLHNRECWRTQERNRMLSIRSSATAAHPPPMVHPEGTQDGKAKDTGPRQPGCVSKEWLLQFPIYRRALNSLTTDVQFSLTNNILLMLKLRYFVHLIWTSNSLEKPCCWERLKSEEEGDRRWDGWMASQIQWMWIWGNSGRYWRTGKPSVLQLMRSKIVWRNLATEQEPQKSCVIFVVVVSVTHFNKTWITLDPVLYTVLSIISIWVPFPGLFALLSWTFQSGLPPSPRTFNSIPFSYVKSEHKPQGSKVNPSLFAFTEKSVWQRNSVLGKVACDHGKWCFWKSLLQQTKVSALQQRVPGPRS